MKRIISLFRLMQINFILMRYSIIRNVLGQQYRFAYFINYLNPLRSYTRSKTRGESIRLALEELGPLFVKFGQLLSTRRDLLPEDIVVELAKLQDKVPPFSSEKAKKIIEDAFQQPLTAVFAKFDNDPLASASIAQVHAACLIDGSDVVVKVKRPDIEKIIRRDILIMYQAARLTERVWPHRKRLQVVRLVKEFENTLRNEMDFMVEAANASQLRRNFLHSEKLYIPKVYWSYTRSNVLTMERIYGIPIAYISALKENFIDLKRIAEHVIEIFFTQVFRDRFFHADLHPGNLFVDARVPENPQIIAVDFGIMGILSPNDQYYLAENLLAFLHRDYHTIAALHVESGWVPPDTRVDQFESAIRTVCEPILERPIKDVSFGLLLLRLFQTAEQFRMEIQPQLLLLQKTLFSIEGLGRLLYPELNMWETAKPFMSRWMREQRSVKYLLEKTMRTLPDNLIKISNTPGLVFDILENVNQKQQLKKYEAKKPSIIKHSGRKFGFFLGLGVSLFVFVFALKLNFIPFLHSWQIWALGLLGLLFFLLGLLQPRKIS